MLFARNRDDAVAQSCYFAILDELERIDTEELLSRNYLRQCISSLMVGATHKIQDWA